MPPEPPKKKSIQVEFGEAAMVYLILPGVFTQYGESAPDANDSIDVCGHHTRAGVIVSQQVNGSRMDSGFVFQGG
jgi:hypothetical protein